MRKLKTKNQASGKTASDLSGDGISLKALVDQGLVLDGVVKFATAKLKDIKAELMEKAKTSQIKKLVGENGQVDVQQSSTTEIGVVDLVRHLRENRKINLIGELLKVKISDAKKVLGEDALKNIMTVDTEAYGKLRFKLKGSADVEAVKKEIEKYL